MLPGAVVLDHAAPYAFCVGGRRHRVVVTSGLLASLTAAELDAVLARHDRVDDDHVELALLHLGQRLLAVLDGHHIELRLAHRERQEFAQFLVVVH